MQDIKDLTKTYKLKKTNATSERADLIGQFHKAINSERQGTRYQPLPVKVIAIKVGHLKVSDLYHLLKVCEGSESFGKCFFGALK